MSKAEAAERVSAFLDVFESAGVYGQNIYELGRIEGNYALTIADLRELVKEA